MVASFGIKCGRKAFMLLWYLCKYLPGSGVGEVIWDLLLPCGVSEQEQVSSSWPLQAPDCSLRVCLVLLQLGVGEMSTLGCSGLQATCPLRCMREQAFWAKQGEGCYGIFWPQWRVTERQWLLTLKLFPSFSSAVRHLLLLPPYLPSTPCLLGLSALCELWQPRWRVQAKKSAEQQKERLLMPRYCVKCMCSLREGGKDASPPYPPSLPFGSKHSTPFHALSRRRRKYSELVESFRVKVMGWSQPGAYWSDWFR